LDCAQGFRPRVVLAEHRDHFLLTCFPGMCADSKRSPPALEEGISVAVHQPLGRTPWPTTVGPLQICLSGYF
jgi:hypothetical protein